VWVIPSEITKALEGLGSSMHEITGIPKHSGGPRVRVDMGPTEAQLPKPSGDPELTSAQKAVEAAIAEAAAAANPGKRVPAPAEPPTDPASAEPTGDQPGA
jgi:hypothetical protein